MSIHCKEFRDVDDGMSGRNLQILTSYRIDPNVIYSGSVDIVKVEYNTKPHH